MGEKEKIFLIVTASVVIIAITFILFQLKKAIVIAKSIADDTLKRRDDKGILRWSATKLTMATAWFVVLWSYCYDLVKNGFNETAFMVLVGVALGAKVTDAFSKKLDPLVQPPNPEIK